MKKDQKSRSNIYKHHILCGVTVFGIVFMIMMVLYWISAFAPFGENHLALMDAKIQYLDFFSYFKDVLAGDNDISYTFGKTLGGNNIAVFSYYLSSPFNLLVVFFDKTELLTFFDILVALKLGTAAVTFSCFLRGRFQDRLKDRIVILLSVCYALSQYNIAQSSNIMWLDGVYLLPLILLGVYKLVRYKKMLLLSVSVGLSVIFNWYTGGINCLFSVLWFLFELLYLTVEQNKNMRRNIIRKIFAGGLRYICAMILGVMLSACIFLPTVLALQGGRAGFDWDLLGNALIGDVSMVIQGYTLGAVSEYGEVTLFCGSIGLVGCIGFFFLKTVPVRTRIVTGVMLGITILLFYWQPFIALFSLMKTVESYWYRYSYVGIIVILFIAAYFYAECRKEENRLGRALIAVFGFSAVLLILDYIRPLYETANVCLTALGIVVCALLLAGYRKSRRKTIRYTSFALFAGLALAELAYNAELLMIIYGNDDGNEYRTYVSEEQKQIEELKTLDDGIYRISQTATRIQYETGLTANYNEALAYNYWSISGYTSDPDDIQRYFLDKLGYPICGDNMCIVDTSIIAADALLGVKYILSEYQINGLELVDDTGTYNGKNLYENPYCLPFVFSYDGSVSAADYDENLDPFEYQNEIYSQIAGRDVEIYTAVAYECVQNENEYVYTIDVPEGNYVLYGNLVWENEQGGTLNVNNVYQTAYAQWLSPSVFYIPVEEGGTGATVWLDAEDGLVIGDVQFYVLNLDELAAVTREIQSNGADNLEVENGYLKCTVEGEEGESAYISVPYDEGWTITLNGKEIEPELFADCMISIPLTGGDNVIEMTYTPPGIKQGVLITIVSILALSVLEICSAAKLGRMKKRE